MNSPAPRVTVVMPTYNEAENLERQAARVFASNPGAELLVVDDSSPDGTGELADRMAAADSRIRVMHRTSKDGLGQAYLAGFADALEHGADIVVEMDSDGSHPADALPRMVARLTDAEHPVGLVLGSRWVPGGKVVDWPFHRWLLSRSANLYTQIMLRIPIKDATGGYRAYQAEVLRQVLAQGVDSRGYCFQIDLALRVYDLGAGVAEVPITFVEREYGASKMSSSIIVEALLKVTGWGFQRLFGRRRTATPTPALSDAH